MHSTEEMPCRQTRGRRLNRPPAMRSLGVMKVCVNGKRQTQWCAAAVSNALPAAPPVRGHDVRKFGMAWIKRPRSAASVGSEARTWTSGSNGASRVAARASPKFDDIRNAEIVAPHQTFALLCLAPVCAHVAHSADHISPMRPDSTLTSRGPATRPCLFRRKAPLSLLVQFRPGRAAEWLRCFSCVGRK